MGPLGGLFSTEFYRAAKQRLRHGGVLVAQAPLYFECVIWKTLSYLFRHVRIAAVPMVTYPANVFFVATETVDPVTAIAVHDVDHRLPAGLRWYNSTVHSHLWNLEKQLRDNGILPCQANCTLVDVATHSQEL